MKIVDVGNIAANLIMGAAVGIAVVLMVRAEIRHLLSKRYVSGPLVVRADGTVIEVTPTLTPALYGPPTPPPTPTPIPTMTPTDEDVDLAALAYVYPILSDAMLLPGDVGRGEATQDDVASYREKAERLRAWSEGLKDERVRRAYRHWIDFYQNFINEAAEETDTHKSERKQEKWDRDMRAREIMIDHGKRVVPSPPFGGK